MNPYRPPAMERHGYAQRQGYSNSNHRQSGNYVNRGPRPIPPLPPPGVLGHFPQPPPPPPLVNPFGQPTTATAPQPTPDHIPHALTELEKVRVFVGNIPREVSDELVEQLLSSCGKVKSWKRVYNAEGKPQGFGFCEYATANDALRALNVLSIEDGLKKGGWTLPNASSTRNKALIITVDSSLSKGIREYRSTQDLDKEKEEEADHEALHAAEDVIAKITKSIGKDSQQKSSDNSSAEAQKQDDPTNTHGETDKSNGPPDAKDAKYKDTLLKPDVSIEEEQAYEKEQTEHKRQRRLVSEFESREQHLRRTEEEREQRIERHALRELEKVEERLRERDAMALRLAEWDDEKEEDLREHEYYKNRGRWWHHRKAERARELDQDEADRRQQMHDDKHKRDESIGVARSSETVSPATRNGYSPSTRRKTQDPDTENAKKPDLRSMIETLVREIPARPDQLFAWKVQWDYLDIACIESKVEPVVQKRLLEYLGDDSGDGSIKELTEFVVGHIKDRKSPQDLVDELEMILAEEAPVFVTRIWRIVVYESEARARGIA